MPEMAKDRQLVILYSLPQKGIDVEETFLIYEAAHGSYVYSTELGKKKKDEPFEVAIAAIEAKKLMGIALEGALPLDDYLRQNHKQVLTFLEASGPEVFLFQNGQKIELFPSEKFAHSLARLRRLYLFYKSEPQKKKKQKRPPCRRPLRLFD